MIQGMRDRPAAMVFLKVVPRLLLVMAGILAGVLFERHLYSSALPPKWSRKAQFVMVVDPAGNGGFPLVMSQKAGEPMVMSFRDEKELGAAFLAIMEEHGKPRFARPDKAKEEP